MIPAYARPAHQRLRAKLAEIAAWNETEGPQLEIAGSHELGIITSGISYQHVLRGRSRRERSQARHDLPAAGRKDARVRRTREPLPGDRGRRPLPCRGGPRGRHRGRKQAGDVPLRRTERGARAPHHHPRRIARAALRSRASRRNCAPAARTGPSSPRCATSTASSRATSAVTRSACCRRSTPWTRWSAWAHPSASGSACATCCRPSRRGASSA